MTGRSMLPLLGHTEAIHQYVLYGYFGMHVNITDGRYTYMRAGQTEENKPLFQYTLMPWHIQKPMQIPELQNAEDALCRDFAFTGHTPVLKIPVDERYDRKRYYKYSSHMGYGSLLFDRERDPKQEHPLQDEALEQRLCGAMRQLMMENEAPEEQYVRLGLQ